ncbi:MAG: C69 family dipeptidase [Nevskiales bacterium]
MCDTLVQVNDKGVWFAKNSDREPGEPQLVVRLPAVRNDRSRAVRLTHIPIRQIPDRHAVILSKPHWTWGAEMGINEHGLIIGNEAIFSKLRNGKPGMLGMDLVRLGLERAATADEALHVMTRLVEQVGQGGPAGFKDKGFHYDNSFIIADHREAWVLETVQRHWVVKRVTHSAAISNCLTIGTDYDAHSPELESYAYLNNMAVNDQGKLDFAASFDSKLMPKLAKSYARLEASERWLEDHSLDMTLPKLAEHLRSHAPQSPGLAHEPHKGSNADICMHAAGPVRRSQTCGSMIAHLSKDRVTSLFTGTSAPCMSIFRPADFDWAKSYSVLSDPSAPVENSLWAAYECIHHRALFDADFRSQLRQSRDQAEARLFAGLASEERKLCDADQLANQWYEGQQWVLKRKPRRMPLSLQGLYWRHNRFAPDNRLTTRKRREKKAQAANKALTE